jgi:drug/metabolite transporter (DMT)-like permease
MLVQRDAGMKEQGATPFTQRFTDHAVIGWLLIAPFFWAGNFIAGRLLRGDVPPVTFNFWRWVVALVILLPLSAPQLRTHWALLRREWKLIVAAGCTGILAFQIMVYEALTMTTALNATLITAMAPLATVLCGWIIFWTRITSAQMLGMLGALLGSVVVITYGRPLDVFALPLNPGDLVMLAAVVVWAFYSLLLARIPRELPALVVLTATVAVAVVAMLPLYLWRLGVGEHLVISVPNLLGIGYAGTFSSVLAFLAWTRGVARLGPARAGMFVNLIPVFAGLQAPLVLGEPIAGYHLVGAVMVFGGIGLANWRIRAATPRPE